MLNHESLDNTSNLTKEVSQTNPLVEIFNMSSRNHAIIQMRLGAQLNQYEQYTVASELSIDVGTKERQTLLEKCQVKAELAFLNLEGLGKLYDLQTEIDNL